MSEENLSEQNLPPSETGEPLSTTDAMAGVITSPAETFEAVADTPGKKYWVIPIIIVAIVGLVCSYLFMQDTELINKTMDKQKAKMMERFDKNIKEGKMTQEDADKAAEHMNPKSATFKMFGYGGALIGTFLILFVLALVYFIILKIMKADVSFGSILNVVGLAMLITAIGNIIGVVLSILKGEPTSAGLSLILSEDSVGEKMYTFLTKIDLFSIWFYIVVAIGLSKVSRTSFANALGVVIGVFLVYAVVTSFFF